MCSKWWQKGEKAPPLVPRPRRQALARGVARSLRQAPGISEGVPAEMAPPTALDRDNLPQPDDRFSE